jgi:hypothetical protein
MSDPDRGAYTPPTDAPLSFDARQPVRGSRPAPIMLIVSALVLALLVVAIVMFYRSGVREAGAPPQAVGTPVGEMKAPPPASAQPTDPAAGLQIYQSDAPPSDVAPTPTFTAPPEQPQLRPAPTVVQPPPKAAPTAPVTTAPATLPPAKAAPPPPAKATTPPAKTVAPPPPPKAAPAPPPKAASGSVSVQVGAVSSQALADKTWSDAVAAGGGSGRGKRVEAVQKDGATLYRTQVTGFPDRAAAQAFCDRLKAAGKACFVK